MDNLIQNLTRLGLKEYESRVYAALVGIGEGNARQIHEASGVPRPRVYDIAEGLAKMGFVSVRRGTPHLYVPVEPAVVVHQLKSGTEQAAVDAIRELESLSLDARTKHSPIWYVQGDWSIQRHVGSLVAGIQKDMAVVCMDYTRIGEFSRLIVDASADHPVSIVLPNGKRGIARMLGSASLHVPTSFCEFFQENIFQKIFQGPITMDGSSFMLEYLFLADDRVCIIIYSQNGVRSAVIITLPFIAFVQRQYVNKMIAHSERIVVSPEKEKV
jgi:predicted transcriptional regulator